MPASCLLTGNAALYPAGLFCVQCRKFKDQLIAAADAAVHNLLDIVCTATSQSNLRVFDDYQVSHGGRHAVCGACVMSVMRLHCLTGSNSAC